MRLVVPLSVSILKFKLRHYPGVGEQHPSKTVARSGLSSAINTLQELAERHLEGRGESRQMAKAHLANSSFEIGDVHLVNTRGLRQVDLSPGSFLAELSNSLAKLEAYVTGHPLSIDLVEALYLAHALSAPMVAVSRQTVLRRAPSVHDNEKQMPGAPRRMIESYGILSSTTDPGYGRTTEDPRESDD